MLQTPWLKTYEKLGIQSLEPADLTLADYISEHISDRPDTPAIHYFARSWSYPELDEEANKLANALQALGVGAGDVVGFHMPNIPQYVFALIAVSKLGAIGSGVSPLLAPPELAYQISNAKIKVLMSFDALEPVVTAMSAPACLDSIMICGVGDTLGAPLGPPLLAHQIPSVQAMTLSTSMWHLRQTTRNATRRN